MQLMTDVLGGEVRRSGHREFGHALVRVSGNGSPEHADGAEAVQRRAGRAARLGEPWRRRGGGAARVSDRGDERHGADRGDGSAGPSALRAAVPSRGRAHRSRRRDPAELRLRRLRLHGRLDDRVVHRGSDRADPAAGRRGQGRLRTVGRRRFDGRGDADPPRHRRSPDVHLRGQRAAALRRGEPDPEALPREAAAAARLRGRDRPVSRPPRRRHRSRAEAEDHRRHVHRRLRAARQRAGRLRLPRAGHALSGRDRVGVGARARPS